MSKKIDPLDAHIGTRLKALRLKRNLRLIDAGAIVGVSHAQIFKFESGENRVNNHFLRKFAAYYGVSMGWFYRGVKWQEVG